MRLDRWLWTIAFGTCAVLAGCNHLDGFSGLFGAPRITVPAGTEIEVQLAQTVSSESARRGTSGVACWCSRWWWKGAR